MRLLLVVLATQIVEFENNIFRLMVGITMGVNCSLQSANLYMADFDAFMLDTFSMHVLGYMRLADDIFAVLDPGIDLVAFDAALNSWDPDIKVEWSTHVERQVFLDLSIYKGNATDGTIKLQYETYSKPMNTFAYLPFQSCHSTSRRTGIIKTETTRVLRTNSTEQTFKTHVQKFVANIVSRGYPSLIVDRIVAARSWFQKERLLQSSTRFESQRSGLLPFKLKYFSGAEELSISKVLYKCFQSTLRDCRFVTCFSTARNLFRLRLSRFQSSSSLGGGR